MWAFDMLQNLIISDVSLNFYHTSSLQHPATLENNYLPAIFPGMENKLGEMYFHISAIYWLYILTHSAF